MDRELDNLERLMQALLEEHTGLHDLVRRKQQVMRMGRPALIEDCCTAENRHVQRIGGIERDRQASVGRLTEAWAPGADRPLRLAEIAERAGEPRRGRLLVSQRRLVELMDAIRRDNDVAKRATEGLLKHVQGVVQYVTQAVSGAGVYERRGRVATPGVAVSSFTVTG